MRPGAAILFLSEDLSPWRIIALCLTAFILPLYLIGLGIQMFRSGSFVFINQRPDSGHEADRFLVLAEFSKKKCNTSAAMEQP